MTEQALYERIVYELLGEIKAGRLQPGNRVPSEHELAATFGVSRITSRKALEVLSAARVVKRVRGKGTFIADPLPDLRQALNLRPPAPTYESLGNEARLIGFVVPDFSDAYGLNMFYAVEERCSFHDCHLLVKRTFGDQRSEEKAIASLKNLGLNGLVVFPVHGEHYNAELIKLAIDGFPVVLVDRYLRGIPASAIYTDNAAAAQVLTEHLLSRGYYDLAFVSPPAANTSAIEDRIKGFNHALSMREGTKSFLFDSLLSTLPGAFTAENIQQDHNRIRAFVQEHPTVTAFVCSEYNLALITTRALLESGRRIPEDVAVVCFDSPADVMRTPLFTHIQQHEHEVGTLAVDAVFKQIRGERTDLHTLVDFTLVEGRSTQRDNPIDTINLDDYPQLNHVFVTNRNV